MGYFAKAAAGLSLAALLGASAASQATIVQFQTVLGDFEVNLYDQTTPETVANFLQYVEAGAYSDSFMHRSVPGFIVQGGGFGFDLETSKYKVITANKPVINEPLLSNQRGTIAMAKPSGKPNGATNQWFFNLKDNRVSLDAPEGGYTVFGEVTGNGMAIVDAMGKLPRGDFSHAALLGNPALNEVPVRDYSQEDMNDKLLPTAEHIVLVQNIVVLDAAVDTAANLDPKPTTRGDGSSSDGGDSGGGGSLSWLMLLGLLGAELAARTRRKR